MARRVYVPPGQPASELGQADDQPGGEVLFAGKVDLGEIGFDPTPGERSSGDQSPDDGARPVADVASEPASEPASGRKRRSDAGQARGARTKRKAASLSLEAMERLLYSSHTILAMIARTSELALSEDEAKQLAQAIGAVTAHYDVQVAAEAIDWVNLAQCVGLIYGSRIMAIKLRRDAEAASRKPQPRQTPANGPNTPQPGAVPGAQVNGDGLAPGGMPASLWQH